jgi:hypothetical protein
MTNLFTKINLNFFIYIIFIIIIIIIIKALNKKKKCIYFTIYLKLEFSQLFENFVAINPNPLNLKYPLLVVKLDSTVK